MGKRRVFVRDPYNYDVEAASLESGEVNNEPSLTVQSEMVDADINTIVKRFGLTGQLPENVRVPLEADFVDALDFKDAMNAIRAAEESFNAMPADVRSRFGNDPAAFVDYCTDRDGDGNLVHLDEMRTLGLAVPAAEVPPEPEPMKVHVVNPREGDSDGSE